MLLSSKRETLTPLLKAIGADIKYNLGPRLDKVNVVTEGITDYMYFTAMLDYLGPKLYFISAPIAFKSGVKVSLLDEELNLLS